MKLFVTTFLVFLVSIGSAQVKVKKGSTCAHCNMRIQKLEFAATAIKGAKTRSFDAIECLVNHLKTTKATDYDALWVADYSNVGNWIPAIEATYLRSTAIQSPMGAYLSAYPNRTIAENVQQEKGGDLLSWTALVERFKDSDFGQISHPTHNHSRPDAYGPAGVMGDHLHHKGGFMVGVNYMHMEMKGNLRGNAPISDMEIYQDYMMAPQEMTMQMAMVMVMYAPTERFTAMLMQGFTNKEMRMRGMMGMDMQSKSQGIGDLKISALYGLVDLEQTAVHLNSGISFPTGSITQSRETPDGALMRLPYAMQMGSGTTDLTVGVTYKGRSNMLSWGVQQLNTFRTGENTAGYRFGNQFELSSWIALPATTWVSFSARIHGLHHKQIQGQDQMLNPMMSPQADASNSGLTRLCAFPGANFSFGQGLLRDLKLGVEYGWPVYQDVEGVQMNMTGTLSFALKYAI